VAKKKDKAAFFEVISKTRQARKDAGLKVPIWMGRNDEAAEGDQPAEKPQATERKPERPRPIAPTTIKTQQGRLQFSLNYTASVALAVVIVLLLVGAFMLGRATAPAGPGQALAGPEPPYRPDVLKRSAQQPSGGTATRLKGKYYLVIETLKGRSDEDLAEAQRIVEFLSQKGEQATVQTFNVGGQKLVYGIWSLRPFDARDSQEALDYARRIEQLGKEYFEKYKTYRFQQRRRPGQELSPSYVRRD